MDQTATNTRYKALAEQELGYMTVQSSFKNRKKSVPTSYKVKKNQLEPAAFGSKLTGKPKLVGKLDIKFAPLTHLSPDG